MIGRLVVDPWVGWVAGGVLVLVGLGLLTFAWCGRDRSPRPALVAPVRRRPTRRPVPPMDLRFTDDAVTALIPRCADELDATAYLPRIPRQRGGGRG